MDAALAAPPPALARAILDLDDGAIPYAKLWRRVRPVAASLGEPCPSYWRIRRLAIVARTVRRRQREELETMLTRMAVGLAPFAPHGPLPFSG
jgi:hypothetical protein